MLGIIITRKRTNVELQRIGPFFSDYVANYMLDKVKKEAEAFPVKVTLEKVKSLDGFRGKFEEGYVERMMSLLTSGDPAIILGKGPKNESNSKTTFKRIDSVPSTSDWTEDQIREFEKQALGAGAGVQEKPEERTLPPQAKHEPVPERKKQEEQAIVVAEDTITIENKHVNALFAIVGEKDGIHQRFEVQANTPHGAGKYVTDRGYSLIETKRIPKKK